MKVVRERIGRYKGLQKDQSIRERWSDRISGDFVKETSPQYDPKEIDKRISEYENFLFMAGSAIKESNAKTEIVFEADAKDILKPL
ncbi:hypothetical protein A2Z67_05130 [Candidatus Woesebacteria bacterium RBG_13_36_22]|uniref:Uncharacterized protein n=1 Tax=Candidatus Woesebacteria bacterium RBG_13_36_22 TaxID=1802478 RepID=A0A1F7X4R9_9BACT|nr:MAG: hypothetical protein A2Z67_05130 [Candidatus Woesebacteria bacterium RBG_13_36_22]